MLWAREMSLSNVQLLPYRWEQPQSASKKKKQIRLSTLVYSDARLEQASPVLLTHNEDVQLFFLLITATKIPSSG